MGARWVRGYRAVGSFKVKLVVYFLLLSLLPIAATFWGFTSVAGQSETRRVDARLQAGLRAVIASYQERLDGAEREAAGLARAPVFQKPIESRDLPTLVHLLENSSNVRVTAVDGFAVGHPPAFSATREVPLFTRKGLMGTVRVACRSTRRSSRRFARNRVSARAIASSSSVAHRSSLHPRSSRAPSRSAWGARRRW